jgi:hypothetical protein
MRPIHGTTSFRAFPRDHSCRLTIIVSLKPSFPTILRHPRLDGRTRSQDVPTTRRRPFRSSLIICSNHHQELGSMIIFEDFASCKVKRLIRARSCHGHCYIGLSSATVSVAINFRSLNPRCVLDGPSTASKPTISSRIQICSTDRLTFRKMWYICSARLIVSPSQTSRIYHTIER